MIRKGLATGLLLAATVLLAQPVAAAPEDSIGQTTQSPSSAPGKADRFSHPTDLQAFGELHAIVYSTTRSPRDRVEYKGVDGKNMVFVVTLPDGSTLPEIVIDAEGARTIVGRTGGPKTYEVLVTLREGDPQKIRDKGGELAREWARHEAQRAVDRVHRWVNEHVPDPLNRWINREIDDVLAIPEWAADKTGIIARNLGRTFDSVQKWLDDDPNPKADELVIARQQNKSLRIILERQEAERRQRPSDITGLEPLPVLLPDPGGGTETIIVSPPGDLIDSSPDVPKGRQEGPRENKAPPSDLSGTEGRIGQVYEPSLPGMLGLLSPQQSYAALVAGPALPGTGANVSQKLTGNVFHNTVVPAGGAATTPPGASVGGSALRTTSPVNTQNASSKVGTTYGRWERLSGISGGKGGDVATWRRIVIDGTGFHYETTHTDPNSKSFDQDFAIEQQKKAAAKAKQNEQDEILRDPRTGEVYEQWQPNGPLHVSSLGPPVPAQNIQFFISALVLNRNKPGVAPPAPPNMTGGSAVRTVRVEPAPTFKFTRASGGSDITGPGLGGSRVASPGRVTTSGNPNVKIDPSLLRSGTSGANPPKVSSLGSPVTAQKITIGSVPNSGGSTNVRNTITGLPAGGASRMVVNTPTVVPRSLNTNVAAPTVRINTNVATPTVKFTMPTVRTPTVSIKTPTVRINTPTVRVSTVSVRTPAVRLPTVRAPVIRITVPTVRVPTVRVPTISDIRLKRDIVAVGRTENGLQLYRYRYLWSEETYVGVMAQEVLKVAPEAVARRPDGYLGVDYGWLGMKLLTWNEWRALARTASYRPH